MLEHCPCNRFQPSQNREPEAKLVELSFGAAGSMDKQERILRAAEVLVTFSHGIWLASGSKGNTYEVRLHGNRGYCTCPDFTNRGAKKGTPCKHLYAVKMRSK
jgi:predicted nucleic acid-binding Zn finger protein